MALIFADSDVLVDFLCGREPIRTWLPAAVDAGRLKTTVISQFELLAGAESPRDAAPIAALLDSIEIVPLDPVATAIGARVHRELLQRGLAIGMADSLIAGIALSHDASLLTRNRRHFERVRGLELAEIPSA